MFLLVRKYLDFDVFSSVFSASLNSNRALALISPHTQHASLSFPPNFRFFPDKISPNGPPPDPLRLPRVGSVPFAKIEIYTPLRDPRNCRPLLNPFVRNKLCSESFLHSNFRRPDQNDSSPI